MSQSMTERTTVRLPDELVERARRKAAAEGRTLTALIEEGLRLVVAQKRPRPKRRMPRVSALHGSLTTGLNWADLSASAQETEDLEYVERMKRGFE
jgi:hypothetical protein